MGRIWIPFSVEIVAMTDKALLVQRLVGLDEERCGEPQWIPRRQIRHQHPYEEGALDAMFFTRWIADKKGWI